MVKRLFSLLVILIFIPFFSGCTSVYCSTPSILVDGACCTDANKDGLCDTGNFVAEETIPPPPLKITSTNISLPTTPVLTTKEGALLKISQDDDHFLGNANGTVLLTLFGDYAGTNTQRFHQEIIPKLLDFYGSHIRYTFRNYPDLTNRRSVDAAEASECAGEQGKFWEYHEILLQHYFALSSSYLADYAQEAKLNILQFTTCFLNRKYSAEVLQDLRDGDSYGVYMTPTLFINNQRISGFKSFATYQTALESELYDELQQVKGTTVSARSLGTQGYLILEGQAALDPSISQSPYSDVLDFVDSSFTFTATDRTPADTPQPQDAAQLTATFDVKKQFTTDSYDIALTQLSSEGVTHSFFGGVGTQILINGKTGIGTSYLPATTAYVSLWGLSDVSKNGQLIASNVFTHFIITPAIRGADKKILSRVPSSGLPEAYLLLAGKYDKNGQAIPDTDQGFLYLYWDSLDLRQ
ncbi:MAG: thioredoxin domain-containing protein [Nanoarchaeota archaeon]